MNRIINEGLKLVATTTVAECTKRVIETYIKPLLENGQSKIESDKKILLIREKLDEYMKRTYKNNLYINTIVFKNQQKTINDLYIPLTVSKCVTDSEDINIYINGYKENFVPFYKKVLLVDNAGMGKSTILKYLYLSAITENKGFPILIELRKLDKSTSIFDFIMNEINGIKEYFSKVEVIDLIEGGGFIFFFDGYDEVTDESKQQVTENLQDFISKTSNSINSSNHFIISSRDENSLGCFSDFQRFEINPLNKEEAYELIQKYDKDGELSKELMDKLESDENLKIIDEFLTNPLMVSLLYKAFEYKRVVPYKKQIFYRQVYDALFEDHDIIKGGAYVHPKRSKLDIEDFHKVLRALGIITLNKGVSYYKEELVQSIAEAKQTIGGLDFRESDFIHDIIHSVPLFIKDGNEFRWTHKTFQEYFAACYISFDSKEKQSKYLLKMAKEDSISKYYNVLDFCYDIDYKELRNTIIYPILKKYIKYYNNLYCSNLYKDYNQEELDIRKKISFMYKDIYIKRIDESLHENFDEDKFGRHFKDWKPYQDGKISSLAIIGDFGICCGMVKEQTYHVVLRLLKNKHSPIVDNYINIDNSVDQLMKLSKEIEVGSDTLNDNFLNREDIFGLINNFLLGHTFDNYDIQLLNYDESINLINQIERELESEKERGFFL